jgi:hypothetical protein
VRRKGVYVGPLFTAIRLNSPPKCGLERWAYPIIGELPVGGISTGLVFRILVQPIGPEKDALTF